MKVKLPKEIVEQVLSYLSARPYREVAYLIKEVSSKIEAEKPTLKPLKKTQESK